MIKELVAQEEEEAARAARTSSSPDREPNFAQGSRGVSPSKRKSVPEDKQKELEGKDDVLEGKYK